MTGVGLIVIVNDVVDPEQVFAVGVTTMVPTIGALVVLVLENAPIFPVPLAASPIPVLLFVQPNVVPTTPKAEVNVITVVVALAQNALLVTASTVGVGLTVTVTVNVEPTHAPTVGVTV